MTLRTNAILSAIVALSAPVAVVSCSTGVDTTDRIELTKKQRRQLAPSAEDTLLDAAMRPQPLGAWQYGKTFLCASDRAALIFDPKDLPADPLSLQLAGKVLHFTGTSARTAPNGTAYTAITFGSDSATYTYNTGRPADDAASSVTSDRIPMLIDLEAVARVDSVLRGRRVWTMTPRWYSEEGSAAGIRFYPVRIDSVTPGNEMFRYKVHFSADSVPSAFMLMGGLGSASDTRRFASLFSLSDPRLKYTDIYPDIWDNIRHSRVAVGMTKEECRLALGSPSDTDTGSDWSRLHEIWRYPGGTVLWFEDGRLARFRK